MFVDPSWIASRGVSSSASYQRVDIGRFSNVGRSDEADDWNCVCKQTEPGGRGVEEGEEHSTTIGGDISLN